MYSQGCAQISSLFVKLKNSRIWEKKNEKIKIKIGYEDVSKHVNRLSRILE